MLGVRESLSDQRETDRENSATIRVADRRYQRFDRHSTSCRADTAANHHRRHRFVRLRCHGRQHWRTVWLEFLRRGCEPFQLHECEHRFCRPKRVTESAIHFRIARPGPAERYGWRTQHTAIPGSQPSRSAESTTTESIPQPQQSRPAESRHGPERSQRHESTGTRTRLTSLDPPTTKSCV